MNDLAVIVVAYHHADLLDRCLSSLPPNRSVWVIDNSSDAQVKAVAARYAAQYVDTGTNAGFAAGVNAGLRLVPPMSDVLLLNPDATLSGEALSALHASLYAPGAERLAAVSPSLAHPVNHSRQRVRWPLPSPGRMWREAIGLSRLFPPPDEFCIGAALLLRAEAVADVGLFDERFFLYAEEADWQRRALQRGWQNAELAAVEALHVGAGTSADEARRQALFHAGQETYIRKWYGNSGWVVYRTAALLGASTRGLLLRGRAAATARERARLYSRGPRRLANLDERYCPAGRRITHVVVTDAFAGVERYVCEVAREQASRGAVVTVIGGDPTRMQKELGKAQHVPGSDVMSAVRQLARLRRQDVVHAHMTAAEVAAVVTVAWHGAHIIATRHFAGPRGSRPHSRILGRAIRARVDRQVSISHFVAEAIGEPSTILLNGVPTQGISDIPREKVVLCLQRLEREKATHVALKAWAASGLANDGWELHLAGSGALRPELEELAARLGITASVRWLGHVTDTRERLRRAGLLLATATAEPFGLSIAEAMALGTPVVASEGGAHPELLGSRAWTFPAGDVTAAAEVLRYAAKLSPAQRATYGDALRDRQRDLFDLAVHVERLDKLYGEALGEQAIGNAHCQ